MDKIKSLWEEQRGLFLVIAVLLVVVLVFAIINPTWILYLVVAGIVLVVLWLTMDTVVKARKRKQQENLDERIAAKEGIDDRKREWLAWSQELRKHGIDRYELPFYLLVGEPQSGKSILLQNSGLNFPLGQSKLSGPGGTRGCDWWFTEEAVVLDLAGRLFTHEGGASDATEWEAFLRLLAAYRPLSPANGILLVIPCDSLLQDSAEETKRKATRIKESLTTLVDKLEAQLPIYVVLTKADKIFGFAESVHRLDSERRRQMFGWSRSSDDFEKPFSMPEFRQAFERIRTRAHLIRAGAMSSAQVPDALPEIDRLFAFPEELGALAAPLESYMECIFSESALVERLFFRGMYLTSGLQQGAPIAQACEALMGGASEADARSLEGLFTKQRSYFIHDFIQRRVFAERGLVRPTSNRVHKSRKMAFMGYGSAAAITILGAIWFGYSTLTAGSPLEYADYSIALDTSTTYTDLEPEDRDLKGLMTALGAIQGAIESNLPSVEQAFTSNTSDFEGLHSNLCEKDLTRLIRQAAEGALVKLTHQAPADFTYEELYGLTQQMEFMLGTMPGKDDKPMGGFGLGDEWSRTVLSGLLAQDSELAPYFTERTNSAGEVTGPSVFDHAIAIHEELEGVFPLSAWDGNSAALTEAVSGLVGLYTAFLTDGDFGRGELPAPEQTYDLERLALANRFEAVLVRSNEVLSGLRQVDCSEVISSKTRFDGAVRGLQGFVTNYGSIAKTKFWDEYEDVDACLGRVTQKVGIQTPESWSSFKTYAEGLFVAGGRGPLLITWSALDSDRAPSRGVASGTARRGKALLMGRASRLFAGGGAVASDLVNAGSGKEPAAKPTWGSLTMISKSELYTKIGVNEAKMAELVEDCSNEVLTPGSTPNPVVLLEVVNRIRMEAAGANNNRWKSLVEQMRGLQAGYTTYYESNGSDYKALANGLGLSGENDGGARKFGLHIPAAEHLFGMYAILVEMDAGGSEFDAWRASLKQYIDPMLIDAQKGIKDADSATYVEGSNGRYLGALASAWRTGAAFKSQLIDLLDEFHGKKRSQLDYEWEEMTDLVMMSGQLLSHLEEQAPLVAAGYYAGEYGRSRSAWLSGSVDPLLADRVEGFEEVVRGYWREAASISSSGLKPVAKAFHARLKRDFARSVRRAAEGAPGFGALGEALAGVYASLGEGADDSDSLLSSTRQAFSELGSIDLGTAIANGTEALGEDGGLGPVLDLSNSLRGNRFDDISIEDKAKGLVDIVYALRSAQSETPGDVAKYFLEGSLLELHAAMRKDLAEDYAREFQSRVLSAFDDTLRTRLFQEQAEPSLASVSPSDMQAMLKAVYKLRTKFSYAEANPKWSAGELELRLHPFRGEQSSEEWDNFLFSLAVFFKDELDEGFQKRTLPLRLSPDSNGSFWQNSGTLENGTTLAYWWPLGTKEVRDAGDLEGAPFEVEWRFGKDKSLYMAWNSSITRPADKDGLDLTLNGAFAPLALAWHYGTSNESDPTRYLLSVVLDSPSTDDQPITVKLTLPEGFPDLPGSSLPAR